MTPANDGSCIVGVCKNERLQLPRLKFCMARFEESLTLASAALNFTLLLLTTTLTLIGLPIEPEFGETPIVAPAANAPCVLNKNRVKKLTIAIEKCFLIVSILLIITIS